MSYNMKLKYALLGLGLGVGALLSSIFIANAQISTTTPALSSDEKLQMTKGLKSSDLFSRVEFCSIRERFGTYRDFDEFLGCKKAVQNAKTNL